jgi:hypothetical protein
MGRKVVSRLAHGAALCVLVVGNRVARGSFDGQTDSTAIQAVGSLTGEWDEKGDVEVVAVDHGFDERELIDDAIDAGFDSVEEYQDHLAALEEGVELGSPSLYDLEDEDEGEEPNDVYAAMAKKYSVIDDGKVTKIKVRNVVIVRRARARAVEKPASHEPCLCGSCDIRSDLPLPGEADFVPPPVVDDESADEDWERAYGRARAMFAIDPRISYKGPKGKIERLEEKIVQAGVDLAIARCWRLEKAEEIRRTWAHKPQVMKLMIGEVYLEPKTCAERRAEDRLGRLYKQLGRVKSPVRSTNAALFEQIIGSRQEDREALSVLPVPAATRLDEGERHNCRSASYERHLALRRGLNPPSRSEWALGAFIDLSGTISVPVSKRHRRDAKRGRALDRAAWIAEIGRSSSGRDLDLFLEEEQERGWRPDVETRLVVNQFEASQANNQSLANLHRYLRYQGWDWRKSGRRSVSTSVRALA